MLQEAFQRVYPEIERERICVVAGEHLKEVILKQLEEIDERNLILEPQGRNTAAAIGLAGVVINKRDPQASMAVLTADHVVRPKSEFLKALFTADKVSQPGYLVTFGILPDRPATEFGYIEIDGKIEGSFALDVFGVRRFREKPTLDQAEEFVRKGTFLWNSGMFTFRVDALFDAMRTYMPNLYEGMQMIGESIGAAGERRVMREVFDRLESISIDYGIMEKARNIACVRPGFQWDDVGSWGALSRHREKDEEGNIVEGRVVAVDSEDNIVIGDAETLISLIGVRDTVVVKEQDRLLICHRDHDQKVKELLRKIALSEENERYL